jgi:hypothetical protein
MNVCRRTRVGAWGHEFVRNLAGEIGAEFNERTTAEPRGDVTDLLKERSPASRAPLFGGPLHCCMAAGAPNRNSHSQQ